MKWLIASDIHGSAYYCRKLLEAFDREAADRLLLLGDLLYHGPRNDLPKDYDTRAVTAMLNSIKDRILCVRGNCDAEVDQMVLEFPILADTLSLPCGGHLLVATHGHLHNEDSPLPLQEGDIELHGHTHVPRCEKIHGIYYVNPGSTSLPKDGSANGYMTLEDTVFTWKNMEGEVLRIEDLA